MKMWHGFNRITQMGSKMLVLTLKICFVGQCIQWATVHIRIFWLLGDYFLAYFTEHNHNLISLIIDTFGCGDEGIITNNSQNEQQQQQRNNITNHLFITKCARCEAEGNLFQMLTCPWSTYIHTYIHNLGWEGVVSVTQCTRIAHKL